MVAIKPGGGNPFRLNLDPKTNIENARKNLANIGKPPPGGLIPVGHSGFYRTPDTPADPRDCVRYPDSPWCGGNPIDWGTPVGIGVTPAIDKCGFSITATPTLGYIKLPPVSIAYRFEGECRKEPPTPQPPTFEGFPPMNDGKSHSSGFDGAGYDDIVYALVGKINAFENPQQLGVGQEAVFVPDMEVFSGTLRWSYKLYNFDLQDMYCEVDVESTWRNKGFYYTDESSIPDPNYPGYRIYIPVPGDDTSKSKEFWTQGDYWTERVTISTSTFEIYSIEQFGSTRYKDDTQPPPYESFLRDGKPYGHGRPQLVYGRWGLIQAYYSKEKPIAEHSYQHYFLCGVLKTPKPDNPYINNPPPPDDQDKRNCCMSCCSSSPYQNASNDALLRTLLSEVQAIKKGLGTTLYPMRIPASIFTTNADGSDRAVTYTNIQTQENYQQWITNQLLEIAGRGLGGGDTSNLAKLIGSFPQKVNVYTSTSTENNQQPQVTEINVQNLAQYLYLVLGRVEKANLAIAQDQFPETIKLYKNSDPEGNIEPITEDKQLKNIPSALVSLSERVEKLCQTLGIDEFPAPVPANLLHMDGLSNDELKLRNHGELWEWYIRQFDALIGQFGIEVELEHPDPTNKDAPPVKMNLPNIAETLAELFGSILHINMTTDSLMNVTLRALAEAGQAKQQAYVNHMLLEAVASYLDFGTKDKIEKMALSFKPGETNLSTLLTDNQIDVKGVEYVEKVTLKHVLADIHHAAQVIRAVHFRKVDHKGDIAKFLFDQIKGMAKNTDQISDPKDAKGETSFDKFIKDVEDGWIHNPGISDNTHPYGRPYDERPKINKLGENPADKEPEVPPHAGDVNKK